MPKDMVFDRIFCPVRPGLKLTHFLKKVQKGIINFIIFPEAKFLTACDRIEY